jgi:antitoxin component HigA of HigAB toxin-antitoxin module
MFVLNDQKINIHAPFQDVDGTRYGDLTNPADRAKVGVIEIADPERKDDRFYFVQELNEDPWVINTPKPIAMIRDYLLGLINATCEAEMAAVKSGYPESEVLSWAKQETEARAYQADADASTPLIDSLAAARGLTKAELVSRIIAKADAFAVVSGAIIGKRQALEDALADLPDEGTYETHQTEIEAILQAL